MTGTFRYETVDGHVQPPELHKWFGELQDRLRAGRSEDDYGGTLAVCKGLSLPDERFRTIRDAVQWLHGNTKARREAKAVFVATPPSIWVVGGTCLK